MPQNEMLAAHPEPHVEVSIPPISETPYTFAHADGEIYSAENSEAARRSCPYLAKLSIEQCDLMLELSAAGSATQTDRHESAKTSVEDKQPRKEEIPVKVSIPESSSVDTTRMEQLTEATPQTESVPLKPYAVAEPKQIEIPVTEPVQLQTADEADIPQTATQQLAEESERAMLIHLQQTTIKSRQESTNPVQTRDSTSEPTGFRNRSDTQTSSDVETTSDSVVAVPEHLKRAITPPEQVYKSADHINQPLPIEGDTFSVETVHSEINPHEVHPEESTVSGVTAETDIDKIAPEEELAFIDTAETSDKEMPNTLQQTIESIGDEQEVPELVLDDEDGMRTEWDTEAADTVVDEDQQHPFLMEFMENVRLQVSNESPATLEEVRVHSPEESLEDTLALTAAVLLQNPEKNVKEPTSLTSELSTSLLRLQLIVDDTDPSGSEAIEITPEITSLLTEIIELLGYPEPKQTLNTYCETHTIQRLLVILSATTPDRVKDILHETKQDYYAGSATTVSSLDIPKTVAQLIGRLLSQPLAA